MKTTLKKIFMICEIQKGRINKYPEIFFSQDKAKKFIRKYYGERTNMIFDFRQENKELIYLDRIEPYQISIIEKKSKDKL